MCIVFAWTPGGDSGEIPDDFPFSLVIATNRDEFVARPSEPLHEWKDQSQKIYAGKDIPGGGTWLGVSFYYSELEVALRF